DENRIVIIGLNVIGRHLVQTLHREFEITCIDFDDSPYEELKKEIDTEKIKFIRGDATSRLTLQDANIENSSAVIITFTTEKIALEVARIITSYFNVSRVISIGVTPKGCEILSSMNIEVENIFSATANSLRNRIMKTTKVASGIGIGMGEILEIELHPNSRLANKKLSDIAPINWRIGIIYRNGNIIIPEDDTVLKPRDKVVILGEPNVLKTVSEIMSFDFIQFPHQYGTTAISLLSGAEDENFFEEMNYALSVFNLKEVVIFLSKKGKKYEEKIIRLSNEKLTIPHKLKTGISAPLSSLQQIMPQLYAHCGLLVTSKQLISAHRFNKRTFIKKLIEISRAPLLLPLNTFPYEKMVLPIIKDFDIQHLLEGGLEISLSLKNEITAILVAPSEYIATEEEVKHFGEMKKMVSDMSLIYKKKIKILLKEGN
ncbi:MAG: TrkA family potassium uptake protein, partial [Nitrospirae bacterium]